MVEKNVILSEAKNLFNREIPKTDSSTSFRFAPTSQNSARNDTFGFSMPDMFEDKLFDYIHSNGLFECVSKVLLAVSGGTDSTAMACALCRLRQEGRLGCDFVIGHVNHGLRGLESDADEAFVWELGQSLGIAVVSERVNVKAHAAARKLSIETAGRMLRLKVLAAMARQNGCGAIATAHHKDDLAETMVHRLMRGTGFRGLCGIWPTSDIYRAKFIRPMLDIRRSEIIQYCAENKLSWREDASNRAIDFTRNRIRHQLLPVLEKNSDAIVERLSALSLQSRRFLLCAEKHARSIFEEGQFDKTKGQFILGPDLLLDCPPWVFYEAVRQILVNMDVGLRDYKQEHFDSIRRLVEQEKAKAVFPGGVEVIVEKGNVFVQLKGESTVLPQKPIILEIGKTVQFGQWKISSRQLHKSKVNLDEFLKTKDSFVEWFDADKISCPIEIRKRRQGDRFWPIGAKGEKKIARFLMDSGLDAESKRNAFIIHDAEKILWLAPIRMSEPAKVTENTNMILQLSAILKQKLTKQAKQGRNSQA